MPYKIVNKKRFLFFLSVVCMLVLGVLVSIYFFIKKIDNKNEQANIIPQQQTSVEEKNELQQENNVPLEKEKEANGEEEKKQTVTEYENQSYGYLIRFPDDWYINNDDSEAKIAKNENEDGQVLMSGGQTFWSNYPDINKFTPQDKPEDFRLLGLTVYEDESSTVDNFARRIGVPEDAKKEEFQVINAQGVQYVSPGIVDKNPRITIIFKKDKQFYVFKPAFLNGDTVASDIMEGIVKSFTIR